MSALREALKSVKSDIRTIVPTIKKPAHTEKQTKPAVVTPIRPKQYINGYEVVWHSYEGANRKIPCITTEYAMVQFPTKKEDIKLPEGTVRATYNAKKKRVEFFKKGSDNPIRVVPDSRHEPLPLPRYFAELENVEEIFDLDMETGEITSVMKIDVLSESVHWKLRLQEFERIQEKNGVDKKLIGYRLQKYLKNLEAIRGLTIEELSKPIPETVLNAIEYAEKKQAMMAIGGK
jgi:hypothetical protein